MKAGNHLEGQSKTENKPERGIVIVLHRLAFCLSLSLPILGLLMSFLFILHTFWKISDVVQITVDLQQGPNMHKKQTV